MSTYPDITIQLDSSERLEAGVGARCFGGAWLRISIIPDIGAGIGLFIPDDEARVERIASAINAAWDAPAQHVSAVSGKALSALDVTNRFTPPGIRGEDILEDRVATLAWMGDGPDEAA